MIVRFVTTQEVKDKMALSNVSAATPAVDSAITSAHLRMESELSTRFDKGQAADVFFCDPTKGYLVPDKQFRLRLTRGFVRKAPTPVIRVSTSASDSGGEDVSAQCVVLWERGYVFIPEETATGKFVRVSYEYGFNSNEQAPDWLKEAILSYVPASFYMGQPVNRKDSSMSHVVHTSAQHALSVIAPHGRNMNFGLPPVFEAE